MCPLVKELKKRDKLNKVICVTGQHREMLGQVLDAFNVVPDYDLSIMKAK
jgi:UDP-N-acetylglucosamine 2-epimerase (non-hydrolysing)